MKLLFMIVFLAMADRAIPASARRFGGNFFQTSPDEFWRKYGIFSFPRTALAVCVLIVAGLDLVIHIDPTIQGLIAIFFALIYSISASIDTVRARK